MNFPLSALLVALGMLLNGCAQEAKPEEVKSLVGALRSTASVTAHRVDMSVNRTGFGGPPRAQARPDGVQVHPLAKSQLVGAVETIDFDSKRSSVCIFEPGVEYRFSANGKAMGLQVCFTCDEVRFVGGDGAGLSQIVHFDRSVRVEMVRVVKALFPKDPVVQALE